MNKISKDKKLREHYLLMKHSRYLRSMTNLAYNRQNELNQTIQDLGLSNKALEGDNLRSIEVATAERIGGLRTGMLLDAPEEIEKYYHGPLQIAYCLLYAMIEKHRKLVKVYSLFKDKRIDKYYASKKKYIKSLKHLRHSLLHERYDNVKNQEKFLSGFHDPDTNHVEFLLEGQTIFEDMLMRTQALLAKTAQKKQQCQK